MITVDIKSLLGRLNSYCTRSLEAAAGLCVSRTHYEVTLEHMLLKLLENPQSDLPLILRYFEIDPSRLKKIIDRSLESLKSGNASKPVFSPLLMDWFQEAWLVGSIDLGENRIRSGAMILALLNRPAQFSSGECADLLRTISKDALLSRFREIVKGSEEEGDRRRDVSEDADLPSDATALGRFCVDFTRARIVR